MIDINTYQQDEVELTEQFVTSSESTSSNKKSPVLKSKKKTTQKTKQPEQLVSEESPTNQIPSQHECPTFCVYEENIQYGDDELTAGVWYFEVKNKEVHKTKVCSILHIEAVTSDSSDNVYGRLLKFKTTKGNWHEWIMPMTLLGSQQANDICSALLDKGIEIQSRKLLQDYLNNTKSDKYLTSIKKVGWYENNFVLPNKIIGDDKDNIIFLSDHSKDNDRFSKGTIDTWRQEIALKAKDNPILMLAISAAFAGPLLAKLEIESGGIHFVGKSSTGKSTCASAASSVWGDENYGRSWRTTSNGLEGAAQLFNDRLFVLDEIGECDPRDVGPIAYALGNGRGKQRANRNGEACPLKNWRCFVLSTGEITISDKMSEGNFNAHKGQTIRLLDISVERKYGIFDELHGFSSGAELSDNIKQESTNTYGTAGPEFLEHLTQYKQDLKDEFDRVRKLKEFSVRNTEGLHKRAATRFALVALAGELATEFGITGWSKGDAIQAASECFKNWCEVVPTTCSVDFEILEKILDYINACSGSFPDITGNNKVDKISLINAYGFVEYLDDKLFCYLKPKGMNIALDGTELKTGLDILVKYGILPEPKANSNGERAQCKKISGKTNKLYKIDCEKLVNATESLKDD